LRYAVKAVVGVLMRGAASRTLLGRSGGAACIGPFVAIVFGVGGCGSPRTVEHSNGSPGKLSLVISGDTAGWIEPCGCIANQSGGLPRRATFVEDLRRSREVILLDDGGAPAGASLYDRLKFEAILKGEHALKTAAHNLGAPEAAFGADYLRDVQSRLHVPFVSANLRDSQGSLVAVPRIEIKTRGLRIAVVGVVSPGLVRGGLKADEPRDAVLKAVKDLEYDSLIVLAYLPEPELRRLATDLPEADLVVGGPTGQALAPTKVGPTWLASATNKGKFLIELDRLGPNDPWTGQVVEMNAGFADNASQRRNLGRFHSDLASRDLSADQTGFVPRLPPDLPSGYAIAGTESCRECHRDDCTIWNQTRHASAWKTLRDRGDHVDPLCQTCHTTGYGLPGGFASISRSIEQTAVGCESCHGPSRGHVLMQKTKTPFLAKDQCVACHDSENSPHFAFEDYWKRIRHGAASKTGAGDSR
jgi:hypothetical protein